MVSPNFFFQIVSAVFEIFRKKEAKKKHFFHARLQYLTLPCMVKYQANETSYEVHSAAKILLGKGG